MTAYARLAARFARIATIGEAASMLNWDAAAVMPAGGAAARGDQLAVLAGLAHGMLTDPAVEPDLADAEAAPPEGAWDAANLRLMRHDYTRATALPPELVEAQTRANSACEIVWREARRKSEFTMVSPALAEIVRLVRESASALGPALGLSPYDALIDGWQPGVTAAEVTPFSTAIRRSPATRSRRPKHARRGGPSRCRSKACSRRSGRKASAGTSPPVPGSTSVTPGSTAPPTRSAAEPPPTSASPPAMTRPTRRRR